MFTKFKQRFAVMMSMIMVLTMLPLSAFANGGDNPKNVSEITGPSAPEDGLTTLAIQGLTADNVKYLAFGLNNVNGTAQKVAKIAMYADGKAVIENLQAPVAPPAPTPGGGGGGGGGGSSSVRPGTDNKKDDTNKTDADNTDNGSTTDDSSNATPVETTVIQPGSNVATITDADGNTRTVTMDVPPTIKDGRTLMPARFIAEVLGATVDYDGETKQASFGYEDALVVLTLGSKTMLVNGSEVSLLTAPEVIEGRVLLPLRDIQQALASLGLEADVDWNAETKEITILKF